MQFASSCSRLSVSDTATTEVVSGIRSALGADSDLVAVFLTPHHRPAAARIAEHLRESLHARVLIGCTCEGVIGEDDEIEQEPGLSVLAAILPGVELKPFHLSARQFEDLAQTSASLADYVGSGSDTRAFLLLGDPFTTPIDDILQKLGDMPGSVPAFGGMASGANRPGGNALILDDATYTEGIIGVTVSGDVLVDAVVSQGCRPIGRRMLVTGAEENILTSLGNRPALEALQEMAGELNSSERALLSTGLFLGIAVSEYRDEFRRGDFLIRHLIGADPETGNIVVGDAVRAGQTVQFHVRDASTADEDLRDLLAAATESRPAAGALIFSCNGRGTRMFDSPGHDIGVFNELFPGIPAAGFFAMGELGPVGDRSFVHGHTASIALFREPMESKTNLQ